MRNIGLLGGMSWQSSALYYRLLNEGVQQRLGGLHSARCTLRSVDFAEVEALQSAGAWDEAGRLLAEEARQLERAGADVLVLCTNTMHLVAETIESAISIPLLHIGDVTAQAAREAGVRTVALLGTAFTMEQPFLRERLARHGLDVVLPDADERADVHRVIYDELVLGQVRDGSRRRFAEIIGRLADDGVEGVVLGCTEVELLITQDDSPVPVFPTTRLHAEAAVAHALRDD
ncbi:aspartate/glutamate racemase family protein [Aeromicrobium sp. CF4.19]|uniref:aspartate/glutamate racemase family protein n=1 Tax=Aeromicrobium sp. CF4.19 TaxID=3373082 RepID=UPI003EE796EE